MDGRTEGRTDGQTHPFIEIVASEEDEDLCRMFQNLLSNFDHFVILKSERYTDFICNLRFLFECKMIFSLLGTLGFQPSF